MTVDEYEAIRLIDWEGLTQEQSAGQMEVARTTVQGIYGQARRKLARSLVDGVPLIISGGSYELCGRKLKVSLPSKSVVTLTLDPR